MSSWLRRISLTTSSVNRIDTQRLAGGVSTADLDVVNVVPAVHVEGVVYHGGAEQEADLVTRHTDFDLVEVLFDDNVPLRHIGPVNTAGGREHGGQQQDGQ